jgi:acetyltransferase-like isoleucine patch superfamily enzyme
MKHPVTNDTLHRTNIKGMKRGRNVAVYPGATLFPNVELGDNVTIFPGAVIGRPPMSSGATLRKPASQELLPVKIGDNCVIGANAVIYMDVEIGPNSMICDTACVREGCRIGEYVLISMGVTVNYDTLIGNRVKVLDNTHLTGNMVVEDDVFIAMLVTTANDNLMGRDSNVEALETMIGPTVKRFATIGQGACLLPGVSIGENAIVGSNSVVTKDVAPETVVVGVPARRVRSLTSEEIRH